MRREQFGLSADWLAERRVALKRWENGHAIPEGVAQELDIIATAMGGIGGAALCRTAARHA